MSSFEVFGLGSNIPALNINKNTRFKAEKRKYRVSFFTKTGINPNNPDAEMVALTPVKRLYHPSVGYFVDHGPEYQKLSKDGKSGKQYIAVTVVLWPVNASNGQLDQGRLASGEYEVKNWVMGLDKFNQLTSINSEYPLIEHDLKIDCTEVQFQKMNFSPCRDSVLRKLKSDKVSMYKEIMQIVEGVFDKQPQDLARDLTLDQIREKITGEVSSPLGNSSSFSSDSNFDDLLDGVLDKD